MMICPLAMTTRVGSAASRSNMRDDIPPTVRTVCTTRGTRRQWRVVRAQTVRGGTKTSCNRLPPGYDPVVGRSGIARTVRCDDLAPGHHDQGREPRKPLEYSRHIAWHHEDAAYREDGCTTRGTGSRSRVGRTSYRASANKTPYNLGRWQCRRWVDGRLRGRHMTDRPAAPRHRDVAAASDVESGARPINAWHRLPCRRGEDAAPPSPDRSPMRSTP
jgi:hypothetical protein